jgi:hypothetical protein
VQDVGHCSSSSRTAASWRIWNYDERSGPARTPPPEFLYDGQIMLMERWKLTQAARVKASAMGTLPKSVAARMSGSRAVSVAPGGGKSRLSFFRASGAGVVKLGDYEFDPLSFAART